MNLLTNFLKCPPNNIKLKIYPIQEISQNSQEMSKEALQSKDLYQSFLTWRNNLTEQEHKFSNAHQTISKQNHTQFKL